MPNLRHPSLLVVLSLSTIWKNGTGDSVSEGGAPPGMAATTFSTAHGSLAAAEFKIPGAFVLLEYLYAKTLVAVKRVQTYRNCHYWLLEWSYRLPLVVQEERKVSRGLAINFWEKRMRISNSGIELRDNRFRGLVKKKIVACNVCKRKRIRRMRLLKAYRIQ